MKSAEALSICNRYMEELDDDRIKRILKADNMLCRHNMMNRILIDMQDSNGTMTDVRTLEEWYILGRKVVDKNKYVALIVTSDGVSYYDVETGERIKYGELSTEEISMALKSGIIRRDIRTVGTKVVVGYDYNNTEEIEEGLYNKKFEPGFQIMNKICSRLYGKQFTINKEEEDSEHIYVERDAQKAIEIIIDTIVECSNCNEELMRYSLSTMFGSKYDLRGSYEISDITLVQDEVAKILKEYLMILGYRTQANADMKRVEESKRILDILSYMMARSYMG